MFRTNGKQSHLFREGINTLSESCGQLVKEVLKLGIYINTVSLALNGTGRRILTNEESLVKTLNVSDYGTSSWNSVIPIRT